MSNIFLLFTFASFSQTTEYSFLNYIADTNTFNKSLCDALDGSVNQISPSNINYSYLYNNNYCYPGHNATPTTMCFSFIPATSNISLNAGFSHSCKSVSFGPFALYKMPSCIFVTSDLNPTGLNTTTTYTWCVTVKTSGCAGLITFCPYYTSNYVLSYSFSPLVVYTNYLQWRSYNEDDIEAYYVYNSTDAQTWVYKSKVLPLGNYSTYVYNTTLLYDLVYYKVLAVDNNGSIQIVGIITLANNLHKRIVMVYDIVGKGISKNIPSISGTYLIVYEDGTTDIINVN